MSTLRGRRMVFVRAGFEEEKIKLLIGMASDKCNTVYLEDFQRELLETKSQAREMVELKSTIKGRDARKEVRIEQLENDINELAGGQFDMDAENEQLRESVRQLR